MEGGRRSWVREGPLWAHVGHRRTAVDFPKADKAYRGLVGPDGWKAVVLGYCHLTVHVIASIGGSRPTRQKIHERPDFQRH
jgi:hypothetical protein